MPAAAVEPGEHVGLHPLRLLMPENRDELNLEDTTRALREKVGEIKDAPSSEPPEIPALLQTPVRRPASMMGKTPGVVAGLGELGKSLAIGLDFLFTWVAGGAVGYLFDRWKGSFPLGTVIGAGIGFIVGTFRLLKRLNKSK